MSELSSLKVGCGKFFHGKGVLSVLTEEIRRLGGKALIIGGKKSLRAFLNQAVAGDLLISSEIECRMIEFTGECTVARAKCYADMAVRDGFTVFVAVGGGKCIDTVKCASVFSSLPIITVPSSIATCVATSMTAIMYNDKGQREPAVNLEKEVDVCIADRDLISTAPDRTLAAGILDSIAKYPECLHQKKADSCTDCDLKDYIQIINAKGIFDFLLTKYSDIYGQKKDCSLFDDFILTNLLHTSIVSGFANGSGQLAVAHATYDFMRNHNTQKAADFLHGEIVAVGLLVQMRYNGFPDRIIEEVRTAMKAMDMPCTLKDLNYETTNENVLFYIDHISADSNINTTTEKARLAEAVKEIL